jgi:HTH-type transcriptional regulator/antitoxin HipB
MQNTRTIDQVQDELIGKVGTTERDKYENKSEKSVTQPEIAAFRKEIGEKLAEVIKQRGITVEDLAQEIGLKSKTISSILEGKWELGIDTLRLFKTKLKFDIVFEI